jgi:PAS domain S-box-containing protein
MTGRDDLEMLAPAIVCHVDNQGVVTLSGGANSASAHSWLARSVGRSVFDVFSDRLDIADDFRRALDGETLSARVLLGDRFYDVHHTPLPRRDHEPSSSLAVFVEVTGSGGVERGPHERARQLEAMRLVTLELTHELDLRRLLKLIHRRAAGLLGVKAGFVSLYDEATQTLTPMSWEGHGSWARKIKFELGMGISGLVGERRAGMVVTDYRNSRYALPLMLENTHATSVIAEPLLYRDKLVGVLTLDNEGTMDRVFTDQDRLILAPFAAQAAIAVENARLFDAAERELDQRRRAEASLSDSEQRFKMLAEASFEGIAVSDSHVILDVNDQLARMVGHARADLVGQPGDFILAAESRPRVAQARRDRQVELYEVTMLRKDGSEFPAEVRARYATMGGREVRIVALRDITDRRRAEEERTRAEAMLKRVNRHLLLLSDFNQSLVRATDESCLLATACETIVRVGGYRMAFVAYVDDPASPAIRPMAHAGHEDGFLTVMGAGGAEGEPIDAAVRGRRPAAVQDLSAERRPGAWRTEGIKRGFAAACGLPLVTEDVLFGVLGVYSAEPGAFDADEIGRAHV